MNCVKCHRSFAIFRASLRSMPILETIEEVYEDNYEVYDMEPLGEPPEIYFNNVWKHWQSSDWGQWTDIEYDYILVN
jgi:hypothetical protein